MIAALAARGRDLYRSWVRRPVLDVSTDPADAESVTTATSALFCLHADQIGRARTATWSDTGAWRLRLRERRLPSAYLAAIGLGVTGLIAVPYGEELVRCAITAWRRDSAITAWRRDRG